MGMDRTASSRTEMQTFQESRTQTVAPPPGFNRNSVCAQNRHPVGILAARNGMRFGNDLLATSARVAESRSLATNPRNPSGPIAESGTNRLVARRRGQFLNSCRVWGKKTGPNPTDRRKAGSKHHVISDGQGIPLAVILTGANAHDVTQLLPLVEAIPAVKGKPGRPRRKPDVVQGDRGYDSEPHRKTLRSHHIQPLIAKRNTGHGSGLGTTRWVIERTIAWLHQFRRLRIRYERLPEIHEAFLSIGCALICWNFLNQA